MSCAAGVSSQLTVAMATNPNVNTGSGSEQSSEYKQSVNLRRATQFLVLPLLLSAPHSKPVRQPSPPEHPEFPAVPGRSDPTPPPLAAATKPDRS